ncbi:hypothetical protein ZWY2020_039846 [Hordeum vulgare]|nr:hypothetical protein ZWY2020_039846 [Hordeum vulgare]
MEGSGFTPGCSGEVRRCSRSSSASSPRRPHARAPPRLLSLRHSRPPPPCARVLAARSSSSFSRAHRLRLLTSLLHLPPLSPPLRALRAPIPSSSPATPRRQPSSAPFVSFYARNRLLGDARRVLNEMPRRDTAVCNALLSAYARAGLLDAVEKLFGEMPDRNIVS